MAKLPMCRICLVANVRINVVVNKSLHEVYEKLTDIPFVTEDRRPMLACFFCCAKLKQCYRLLTQCLEAEKLFAQMMNEDYEPNSLINQDHLEFFSGLMKSPTENISIVDVVQTESIAIKEELPAVSEGLDDIVEPKEEHQSDDLEPKNTDNNCLDEADIPPYNSESDLEDDVPIMVFKTEVEEEQEVSKKKRRASETTKLAPKNSCLDVADKQICESDSDLEDDAPLTEFNTEVEEQAVSKNKRRAREATRATVAKKPKLDTRRTKLEDTITAEQTKKEISDSKVSRIIQKRTSKPGTYFKEPYECDQRSLNPVKKMIQHTRTQIGEKSFECDICQRGFSQSCHLKRHIQVHTGKKPYNCDICQRSFGEKSVLIKHIRIHTGEKPFKCDICQCSFRQNSHLTSHIRQHTGEKPYKCDVCQRSFSEKGHLSQHIRIHTGEKPYKCDVCQRSFSQKGHLKKHIRIHTRENPFKCDVCQRSFYQKSALTSHIRIHTGEKPYKCDVCQRNFNQKAYLAKHIRIHTGEKPFKRM